MLVVAGVAPDLDYASYLGGAAAFLRFDRTLLHSAVGAAATACIVAGAFVAVVRVFPTKRAPSPHGHAPKLQTALGVCCIGVLAHLALDLVSGVGVNLLWPFRTHWFGLSLAANLDPWILVLLIAGILLPELFRLVSEEIGERKKGVRGRTGAIVALLLLIAYVVARADLYSNAMSLLMTREYHGRAPLTAGAFPSATTPFDWRGVVSTDNTLEESEVSLAPGVEFDSDRSLTHYKPQDSPVLDTGLRTEAAKRFLSYARFPLATVDRLEDGYRFELRDLRFAPGDNSANNIIVRIDFDSTMQINGRQFRFASQAD